jgi:peptide/nickel transport system permease protein
MLPAAACLALTEAARLARHQRGALLVALAAEYVTTARAKGAGTATVARHALANALLPMITLAGAELPALLSAAVVVEQVFGLPGLGRLAFDAVLGRDVPLLLGLTTLAALLTLAAVLAADVAYALADPRLRGKAA